MAIATKRDYILLNIKRNIKLILKGHRYQMMRLCVCFIRIFPNESWMFIVNLTDKMNVYKCIYRCLPISFITDMPSLITDFLIFCGFSLYSNPSLYSKRLLCRRLSTKLSSAISLVFKVVRSGYGKFPTPAYRRKSTLSPIFQSIRRPCWKLGFSKSI